MIRDVGEPMLLLALALSCTPPPPPTVPDTGLNLPGAPFWPERGTVLTPAGVAFPDGFGVRRVTLDPGHGTGDNLGSTTVHCAREAEVVLDLATDLAQRLEATGHFEVQLSRDDGEGASYARRVRASHAFEAEALISLHTDARGDPWPWPGRCWREEREPGFAILWADRGDADLVARRGLLARSLATHLTDSGITPYDGAMYGGLYDRDAVPGAFLDRRVLYMLRRPEVPSLILEVYNGLSVAEGERWQEDATRQALADGLAAALVDSLR